MTDKLTTRALIDGTYVDGEQPQAQKLTILYGLTREVIEEIKLGIGSVSGQNNGDLTTATGNPWFATRTPSRYELDGYSIDLDEDSTDLQPLYNNMVSLARLVGPAGALNPQFLGQNQVSASTQGSGFPIVSGEHFQYLPFRVTDTASLVFSPAEGGDVPSLPGTGVFSNQVATLSTVLAPGDFYVDASGYLVSYSPCDSGTTVVYDYNTGLGDNYVNAGYNVIPDPSVLRITKVNRAAAGDANTIDGTAASFKGLEIEYVSGSTSPEFKVTLPEVISVPESALTGGVSKEDWEPGGIYNTALAIPRNQYVLPEVYEQKPSTMVATQFLPEGTLVLWDTENGRTVDGLTWRIEAADQVDGYVRVLRFTGPAYLATDDPRGLTNDADTSLATGGFNTGSYFLCCIGTQITTLLSQLTKTARTHTHDGVDAERIPHENLANLTAHSNAAGAGTQTALGSVDASAPLQYSSGGVVNYFVRDFFRSFIEGNDHPQYLNRLGHRGGGTDGHYADETANPINMGNTFMGDLVFGPTQDSALTAGYSWGSGDIDLTNSSPGHSLWFGLPPVSTGSAGASRAFNKAVRVFFDANIETEEDKIFVTGRDNVSLYGIGPGLASGLGGVISPYNEIITSADAGLNIQRGHFFFGFNDHSNSAMGAAAMHASASWRASEFAVVANSNFKAGRNTSGWRGGVKGLRDGVVLKGQDGASVYQGVGGTNELVAATTPDQGHVSLDGNTGAIAGEAAFGSLGLSYSGKNPVIDEGPHGSGYFFSPGLGSSGVFPWQGIQSANSAHSGWTIADTPGAASFENRGGFFQLSAYASKESIDLFRPNTDSTMTQSAQGPRANPWGRGVIDTTFGLDLLANLQVSDDFASGYPGVFSELTSQPHFPEIRIGAIGRMDRFMDDAEDRTLVHSGANLNLGYGLGRDYDRFNILAPWQDTVIGNRSSSSGNAKTVTSVLGLGSDAIVGWTHARPATRVSPVVEDHGANITQVSTVEAFNGYRSDPTQPYVATYHIPFSVKKPINGSTGDGTVANAAGPLGVGINGLGDEMLFVLGTVPLVSTPAFGFSTMSYGDGYPFFGKSQDGFNGMYDQQGFHLFVDQLIRHHDAKLSTLQQRVVKPGESVVNFQVTLDQWHYQDGVNATVATYEDGNDSAQPFKSIEDGDAEMYRVGEAGWNSDSNGRPIPVKMASNSNAIINHTRGLTHSYNAYLGLDDVNVQVAAATFPDAITSTQWAAYLSGFPGHGGDMQYADGLGAASDKAWALTISVDSSNSDRDGTWPMGITVEDFGGTGIKYFATLSGVMTIQVRTQDPFTEMTV